VFVGSTKCKQFNANKSRIKGINETLLCCKGDDLSAVASSQAIPLKRVVFDLQEEQALSIMLDVHEY